MGFPLIRLGVPPCWRAYFLLLRQKKVAKEKATPGYAAGVAGSPALLDAGGGCGTRGFAPQTVLALFPPAPALLGAPHGDPKGVPVRLTNAQFRRRHSGERRNPGISRHWTPAFAGVTGAQSTDGLPGPLRGAEQRRNAGGSRLAVSEPQASLASRPAFRVAQGTRQRRAPTQGWPFLWLLSFGHTKESTPANKAEPQANSSTRAQGPAPC